MNKKTDIVFISLAKNQSRFFMELGSLLQDHGYGIYHVCFHEGAVEELVAKGWTVFNPYKHQPENPDHISFDDFGISSASMLIGHEKAAYELRNTKALITKFKGHLGAMDSILAKISKLGRKQIVIQELGGFTSVLAAFYAARKRGIDNWFIEPSFFKGRVFFSSNTFQAPNISEFDGPITPAVSERLRYMREQKSVVIPEKDALHYRDANKKLTDIRNFKRLIEKIFAKYVYQKQEEFQHIGGHIRRHVRMYLNSKRLGFFYRKLPADVPYIYYPLHVPADFALTVRSPEYLDQLATIDYLCRTAPIGWRVLVKEHPALIGALDPGHFAELIKHHDNLDLLLPSTNNHRVLESARIIVTINSKAGAEALLYGKKVLCLGDSFYRESKLVTKIESLADLPEKFFECQPHQSEDEIESFFQGVWEASYPGELYDTSSENIANFCNSIIECSASIESAR